MTVKPYKFVRTVESKDIKRASGGWRFYNHSPLAGAAATPASLSLSFSVKVK